MKMQLLQSLVHHCRNVQQEVASATVSPGLNPSLLLAAATNSTPSTLLQVGSIGTVQREAGNLIEACDKFAMEARRVGTADAEVLAEQFEAIKQSVLKMR